MITGLRLLILGFLFVLSGAGWAQDFVDHNFHKLQEGQVVEIEILKLRPTQANVGYQQIETRKDETKHFSDHEWKEYLKDRAVPVVIGPGGEVFMIDHHHQSYEAFSAGQKKTPAKVIANLSHMRPSRFWALMTKNNWTYLYDNVKDRMLSPKELPKTILKMGNDPFRSLGWMLKNAGGFIKSGDIYFIEFKWGKALKAYFKRIGHPLKNQWNQADVDVALKFAYSDESATLPGSKMAKPMCSGIYKAN